MKTRYVKTLKESGTTEAMDGIDGNDLLDGDACFVGESLVAYFYILDATSGAAESSPDVIAPDVNPGTKRWLLQQMEWTGFTSTSTTSVAIAVGSKTFTVAINKGFVMGQMVMVAHDTTNWMHGNVTSYTAATGELIVNVTTIGGSGTEATWTVSLSSPTDTKKVEAAVGFTIAGGTTEKILTVKTNTTLFEAGTKVVFYQDTAPTGWTIVNTLDDKLLFITKGSGAGGQTGGGVHSTGTWTLSGVSVSVDSHTLTVAEMPEHTHPLNGYITSGGDRGYPNTGTTSGGTSGSTGGGGGHVHPSTVTFANTWRPAAYCAIIAAKD